MTLFDVDTVRLLLVTLAVVFIYWLWTKSRRSYTKFNIPPFPVKPWPFFGHFFMLQGDLKDKLAEWRRTTGNIYSLDTVGQLNILVNDFKDIKEIWVKQADRIINLQHSLGDEMLDEIDTGLTAARDDNWKEQRAYSLSILRNFGMGKNLMAEKIEVEVDVVVNDLVSLKGQPKDVRLLFSLAIANVISSVACGQRFEYDDPNFVKLINPLNIFVQYFAHMMVLSPFRQVIFIPGDLFHVKKWAQASIKVNDTYTKPFIEKFKQDLHENEEPQNFISAYLKEMKRVNDKGIQSHLSEKNLVSIVRTLFGAGTETTTNTLLWCLLFMLHYPHVQEKVYQEIQTIVGTERRPNMSDKPKLTYLNAVILETQRVANIVPVGFRREVSETFEYAGFTFPKGCVVWPVLDTVHCDKKIWGDPEIFRPERFIDKTDALINREEFIPFGIGKRICLGEALAKMELFLFLSSMLQRFKFEPANKSDELPTLKEIFGTTLAPQAFKLRFIDRKV